MSNPPSNTRRFVNAAWRLLAFQLVAAVGAVGVTGYALQHVDDVRSRYAETQPASPAPAAPTPAPAESAPAATPAAAAPTCLRVSNRYLVPANVAWCDTGITLAAGDVVGVPETRGQWTTSGEAQWGRGGWYGAYIADAVIPTELLSSLIGRVGDTPVAIGNATSFVSPASGTLYLGINDNGVLNDNQGWLEVSVVAPTVIQ